MNTENIITPSIEAIICIAEFIKPHNMFKRIEELRSENLRDESIHFAIFNELIEELVDIGTEFEVAHHLAFEYVDYGSILKKIRISEVADTFEF